MDMVYVLVLYYLLEYSVDRSWTPLVDLIDDVAY